MSEDDKTKIPGGMIQAVSAVASTYKEEFLPAAQQAGKALDTVGRAVNVALSPVLGMVWAGEQLKTFVADRVMKKLAKTPPEQIAQPKTSVVAPALEAVRFKGEEPELQDLFANLIAAAMDKRMAARVFPHFVEMLRQLTPDEARVLHLLRVPTRSFAVIHVVRIEMKNGTPVQEWNVNPNLSLIGHEAGCEHPEFLQSYLNNLERLGIIEALPPGRKFVREGAYTAAEAHPDFIRLRDGAAEPPCFISEFRRSGFNRTSLGSDFITACVIPYEEREQIVMDE